MDTKTEVITNMPALLESSISSRNKCLAFCQSTQISVGLKTYTNAPSDSGWHERDCGNIQRKAERRADCSVMGHAVALGKAAV